MYQKSDFPSIFKNITGHKPFPWQIRLFDRLINNDIPEICHLPSASGKTSIITVWLIACFFNLSLPKRLVYVINRRTVVDQTTTEAELLKKAMLKMRKKIYVSTLRGQFADNQEWTYHPDARSIIVGTVDMIGSRLLFNGYRTGYRSRSVHAGLLAQNVLLIHDESHLEPAFQNLLETIKKEQRNDFEKLHVMQISATPRHNGTSSFKNQFFLATDDYTNPILKKRLHAKKQIELHEGGIEDIYKCALKFKNSNEAVLIYVKKVEDVNKIVSKLKKSKQKVQVLTGTLRGFERDRLLKKDPIFSRFLPDSQAEPLEGTVYIVSTSAGEVGVNMSADHLVCDLSTFENMYQRFGRVNRFGEREKSEIHIFYPKNTKQVGKSSAEKPDKDKKEIDYDNIAIGRTLTLLESLNGDGSLNSLDSLNKNDCLAAYSPMPKILPVSTTLFDAWSFTSIKSNFPGRPLVDKYLHGNNYQLPETYVAWREEVEVITGQDDLPEDLLKIYPLKPHELLRDTTKRVKEQLAKLAEKHPGKPVWIIDQMGSVTIKKIDDVFEEINYATILLPPSIGGLNEGMLDGESTARVNDIADKVVTNRKRIWDDEEDIPDGMRLVKEIDTRPDEDDFDSRKIWKWFSTPKSDSWSQSSIKELTLESHTDDVIKQVVKFSHKLDLPKDICEAMETAAKWHDVGKSRKQWQMQIGNPNPEIVYAKPGKNWKSRKGDGYRHEFGSLLDFKNSSMFKKLPEKQRELALHLIAVHHGWGRPIFENPIDYNYSKEECDQLALEISERFIKLQFEYGRWGLAYLEAIFRSADWSASANPS